MDASPESANVAAKWCNPYRSKGHAWGVDTKLLGLYPSIEWSTHDVATATPGAPAPTTLRTALSVSVEGVASRAAHMERDQLP